PAPMACISAVPRSRTTPAHAQATELGLDVAETLNTSIERSPPRQVQDSLHLRKSDQRFRLFFSYSRLKGIMPELSAEASTHPRFVFFEKQRLDGHRFTRRIIQVK